MALLALGLLGALLLGPVGFFLTIGARKRLRLAEQRILELQTQLRAAGPAPHGEAPIPQESASLVPEPAAPSPALPADAFEAPREPAPDHRQGEARRSLEETLGTRWSVWVGGIALALGGLLLVRYSIDQGWFGPAARIAAGLLFAATLVAGGEYLRRKEAAASRHALAPGAGLSAPSQIPAVLTAAGTAAAFGSIYSAHALYGFIGPTIAFAALGATGLACMFAAALHGPALAGLGVVGALAAPLLVTSDEPSAWPLVVYVAVVTACAYGLARLRLWLWLALAAAAGGLLWGMILIDQSAGQGLAGWDSTPRWL